MYFLSLHRYTPLGNASLRRQEETRKDRGAAFFFPCARKISPITSVSAARCSPPSTGRSIHAAHEFVPLASRPRHKRVNYRCASRYTVYRGIPPRFSLRRVPGGREVAARAKYALRVARVPCASTSASRQLRAYGAALSTTRHSTRGNGGPTRELAGRRGHRRVVCACANIHAHAYTHIHMNRVSVEQPATPRLAVPESPVPASRYPGRPRFGTGIGHFSNRKSGVSRYPLRARVRKS